MMINKRLIGMVSESKKYVAGNVALQWCSLAANIAMMTAITGLLAALYEGSAGFKRLWGTAAVALAAVVIRFACTVGASRMDLISYGGAALGVVMAATQFRAGHVSLAGCLLIILLSADFFIPMRQLGSFFHIAMNGMAASDKIFRLLDLSEPVQGTQAVPADRSIQCSGLHFSYEENREVLHGIDLEFPMGGFTAIVGESGCGKSTVAGILMGHNKGYGGSVTIGGVEMSAVSEAGLMEDITYISQGVPGPAAAVPSQAGGPGPG